MFAFIIFFMFIKIEKKEFEKMKIIYIFCIVMLTTIMFLFILLVFCMTAICCVLVALLELCDAMLFNLVVDFAGWHIFWNLIIISIILINIYVFLNKNQNRRNERSMALNTNKYFVNIHQIMLNTLHSSNNNN